MGRKMSAATARIRKSFDLTELAFANLVKHSQVTGTPVVGIVNLLAEKVLPKYTAQAERQKAQAEEVAREQAKVAQEEGLHTPGA